MMLQEKSTSLSGLRSVLKARETPIFILVIVFSIILSVMSPYFLTYANLRTTLIALSLEIVVMIGVCLTLIGGGMDISVGSVLGLGSAVVGLLLSNGFSPFIAIILALLVTSFAGSLNGWLITRFKIPAIIITLGMFNVARGLAYVLTKGVPATGFPEIFSFIGQGRIWIIPVPVIIAIVLLVVFAYALKNVTFFHQLYFIGSNNEAARLSGIKIDKITMIIYTISGFLAGLAGIIMASRLSCAQPGFGEGYEFRVITAALIGGVSLSGGKGTLKGAAIGALFMAVVNNSLTLLDVSIFWQKVALGALLLFAVVADQVIQKRRGG